ncbi:hypothetical protein KPH14_007475 [Odynerus spinipes]|uniref:Uncharacterized protein n=1 Tax=Odynerus spinipes TaxID=1348599 RepID=A0AAD9RAJ1_9HYME|nr:hypothetical protein KPH14_007475 [Odynerus spinipes]
MNFQRIAEPSDPRKKQKREPSKYDSRSRYGHSEILVRPTAMRVGSASRIAEIRKWKERKNKNGLGGDNVHLPGFLRELHSTGGCAEAATATEGLPPEAASLTAFGKPVKDGKSD